MHEWSIEVFLETNLVIRHLGRLQAVFLVDRTFNHKEYDALLQEFIQTKDLKGYKRLRPRIGGD